MVGEDGADPWFWIHVAQALIFTVLAILAFRHLAKVTEGVRAAMADAGDHEEPRERFRLFFAAELAHEPLVEVDSLPDRYDRIGQALEEDQLPAFVQQQRH